ncbi:MAG: hypothetical protein A3G27_01330 [Betaproteobacteria bacterium RIFCSPLOWO2_12_FULL_66_14]|nr:MAG: hypothetical protein A3G27_01330 [Betaproteobacteria bacterium RIFCSPLOWO2_12_FULL_66_14]
MGVVNRHAHIQHPRVFTLGHDLQQFVFHEPGGLVAHPEMAIEFQRRDVVLGLRHQVYREKPARQRQLGPLEDRAEELFRLLARFKRHAMKGKKS